MKRPFALILTVLLSVVLFGGLVYGVLVAAHVSQPTPNTVRGLTPRRAWATVSALLALIGVVVGAMALVRPISRFGASFRRLGAVVALVAGLIAAISGGLNLTVATGGPGTGNGVVGAAGAIVLGMTALILGGLTLSRSRRTHSPAGLSHRP